MSYKTVTIPGIDKGYLRQIEIGEEVITIAIVPEAEKGTGEIYGCMKSNAVNYNPSATEEFTPSDCEFLAGENPDE